MQVKYVVEKWPRVIVYSSDYEAALRGTQLFPEG